VGTKPRGGGNSLRWRKEKNRKAQPKNHSISPGEKGGGASPTKLVMTKLKRSKGYYRKKDTRGRALLRKKGRGGENAVARLMR